MAIYLDDEIIQETPDMESQTDPPEKKQKCEEDVLVVAGYNQPSPDLFTEDDDDMCENDASIPPNQVEQKGDPDHFDENGAMLNDNTLFENPLASPPNEQATPPNPFSLSYGFCSEKINIEEIIAALVSQPTSQIQQQPQSQAPSQQQEQEQRHQQQQQQQKQLEKYLPPNSPEKLTVEKLIEELSLSHERVNNLLGKVKESS